MKIELENTLPADIEKRSMEIIAEGLDSRGITLDEAYAPVIKRVIHTTADFDYAKNLVFTDDALAAGIEALEAGATIVTDTNMAYAGINKAALGKLGGHVVCFMSDPDIAQIAHDNGTTRAHAAMDRAAHIEGDLIFAIGNAPTALIRLYELIEDGIIAPRLIVGVPVGFVNVVESKELILTASTPAIVARGRKGGSNVAAAIVNALMYQATGRVL